MSEILGMFNGLLSGFGIALTLTNLTFALIGALLGTVVGILPGLGPAATIALLLPIRFQIGSPVTSIIMMAGIFYGAMYGGPKTASDSTRYQDRSVHLSTARKCPIAGGNVKLIATP